MLGVTISTVIWVAMLGALLLVPFGLPGVWIMTAAAAALVLLGHLGWGTWLVLVLVAAAAEGIEFLALKKVGERYGASRKAFWGAIVGGFAGIFVGVPIPFLGPVITALAGSFAGAAIMTYLETTSVEQAGRVGWGTLVARVLSIGVKVAAGVFVLLVTGLALLVP